MLYGTQCRCRTDPIRYYICYCACVYAEAADVYIRPCSSRAMLTEKSGARFVGRGRYVPQDACGAFSVCRWHIFL